MISIEKKLSRVSQVIIPINEWISQNKQIDLYLFLGFQSFLLVWDEVIL